MFNFEQIGARLREERIRLGLNQKSFAELAGASISTQTRYETGEKLPKLEYILQWAEHGVDVGYVLTSRRYDGSLGAEQTMLLEMFERLNLTQREAIIRLLMAMTDRFISTDKLAGIGNSALHDRNLDFSPKSMDK